MNLSKLLRTPALLGVLGGVLLNAPCSHAMEDDDKEGAPHRTSGGGPTLGEMLDAFSQRAPQGGSAVTGPADLTAMFDVLSRIDPRTLPRGAAPATTVATADEKPFLNTLPPQVASGFLAKFEGVSHELPVTLRDGRSSKVQFRLMMDTQQDLEELRALFGSGDDSQYKIMMRENAAAIMQFMMYGRAGKFKWFFACSDAQGTFRPAGFIFLEAPEIKKWDFAAMMSGPITPEMMIAASQSSIYATEAAALKPVLTVFFKAAISKCGVDIDVSERSQPWDAGAIMTAFNGESGMISQVGQRFNLEDFKDVPGQPGVTYAADLLLWEGGEEKIKAPLLEYAARNLLSYKTKMGLGSEITAEDRAELERTYGTKLQKQALAFIEYDAYLRSGGTRALNLEGLTWIITKKGPGRSELMVVGTLIGEKGATGAELDLDSTLFPSVQDPLWQAIGQFFTRELNKSISRRR